jgi:hypothetical protein
MFDVYAGRAVTATAGAKRQGIRASDINSVIRHSFVIRASSMFACRPLAHVSSFAAA